MNFESKDRQSIAALLRQQGIRVTTQRLRIAAALMDRPQHLCADQILRMVNRNGAFASKATVYNTLGLLVEKGLIGAVHVDPRRVFYDSNTDPHCHFYNEDTGKLTDFSTHGTDCLPDLPENTVKTGVDIIVKVRNCPDHGHS